MLLRKLLALALLAPAAACTGLLGDTIDERNGARGETGPEDEIFPPSLLEPYTGKQKATYDNTFITYDQLRGKVRVIFDDQWIRDGVDRFAEHIGPLGGADFQTRFSEARAATSDFLLTLDVMSKDVCARAVAASSGPFAGLDVSASIIDVPPSTTVTLQAENETQLSRTTNNGGPQGVGFALYTNGSFISQASPFSVQDRYRVTLRAYGSGGDASMDILVGSTVVRTIEALGGSYADYSVEVDGVPGAHVSAAFTNDGAGTSGDRNVFVDYIKIEGPLTPSTGTARQAAATATLKSLYSRLLYRSATDEEANGAYGLLKGVYELNNDLASAWSGVCEALVRTPDFLFTLPPSRAAAQGKDREVLLLTKVALDLVSRSPTSAEVDDLVSGRVTIEQQIDTYLSSNEFRDTMLQRMRLRTESNGTPEGDEAARLWTYLLTTGATYEDLLTGMYNVDASYEQVARPAYHGRTGVLTMKGYMVGKPSLPHYNYSARVLTDFLGYVFEVPPEVVNMRIDSTASSTVDPQSVCYSCHQLLTPLAYQRRKWTDEGEYRETDEGGTPIDDSDGDIVASYPFKGTGMEAFAMQAVRKEKFIRHTLNAEFDLLFRRLMRADDDERTLYKELYDELRASGDLRKTLKILLLSPQYSGDHYQENR